MNIRRIWQYWLYCWDEKPITFFLVFIAIAIVLLVTRGYFSGAWDIQL